MKCTKERMGNKSLATLFNKKPNMKKDSETPRPRYFTPNEVSSHNTASDIWVSFLGHVYDLSKLVEEHSGSS